jgi:hypothetical protein
MVELRRGGAPRARRKSSTVVEAWRRRWCPPPETETCSASRMERHQRENSAQSRASLVKSREGTGRQREPMSVEWVMGTWKETVR